MPGEDLHLSVMAPLQAHFAGARPSAGHGRCREIWITSAVPSLLHS
jgi:hypothetical protein